MPFSFSLSRRSSHASTSSAASSSSASPASTAPSSPSSSFLPTFKPSSFELLEPISPCASPEELYAVEFSCDSRKGKGKATPSAHAHDHAFHACSRRASTFSTFSTSSTGSAASPSSPRCNAASAGSFKARVQGGAGVCSRHGIVHNAALGLKRDLSSESGKSIVGFAIRSRRGSH